jgi:cysteine desulfurase
MRTIYLDYNATTPLDPAVRAAMEPFWGEIFGNPSSTHTIGRQARALLDEFRERVARLWTCRPSEVVFTSGGTEANNLAVLGTARALKSRGRHLVTSAIEHPSVLRPFEYLAKHEGFDLSIVRPDPTGKIQPEAVLAALRDDTILVSVMTANNEIGTLQPVSVIGRQVRERGILFHTDASQWFGKEPVRTVFDFESDLVTCCAHKFHGPKGAGALFVRSPLKPHALHLGGSQENEHRGGTENLAAIAGLVLALEKHVATPAFCRSALTPLTQRLEELVLSVAGVHRWGPPLEERLANTLTVSVDGCDSLSLLAGLDLEGICTSSGSACSAGSLEPSRVLLSLGATASEASSMVRFSLGRDTALADIETVATVFRAVVQRVRNQPE